MKEISAIVAAYEAVSSEGLQAVLATVVHVEGSSYRRAGARMLVDEYGRMTGAISGGCLEGDALQKALFALQEQQNKLVQYDTSDESDSVIGAQLGCNGIIQVLFEPILEHHNPILLLETAIQADSPSVICTGFTLHGTQHIGTIDLNNSAPTDFSSQLISAIHAEISSVRKNKTSSFIQFEEESSIQNFCFQYLALAPQLVIVGAGHDAVELANMAKLLGWKVVITDGRSSYAKEERFTACTVIVSNPEYVLEGIQLTENTAFVLLSHNYQYDTAVLSQLIQNLQPGHYIGILGPRKKYDRMKTELIENGLGEGFKQHQQYIYAPIGLQLGAETPSEIALSILSEIQAYLHSTKPEHLSALEGPIHAKTSQQFRIQAV